MRIYKDDMVVVLSGANVGDRGRVISVNRENETVIVEGVHTIHKHVKKSKRNPQGGRLTKDARSAIEGPGDLHRLCQTGPNWCQNP